MGVDTKAIIRKGTTLDEIVSVIEKHYADVKVHGTHENYFFHISFRDYNEKRSLAAFFNNCAKNDYEIDGVLLSLGYWGRSVGIMENILDEFGGYIDKSDSDDIGFEPYNLDAFSESKEFTPLDEFKNKIVQVLGYDNLQATLNLFKEYKNV